MHSTFLTLVLTLILTLEPLCQHVVEKLLRC